MAFALGNAESVFAYDFQGNLCKIYDNFYNAFFAREAEAVKIQPFVRQLRAGTEPRTIPLTLEPSDNPPGMHQAGSRNLVDFYMLPDPSSHQLFTFSNLEYLHLLLQGKDVPDHARWDVFDLSYEKNLDGHAPGAVQASFSTNRWGFRAPDVATPKPQGVFRVICLGGSTTEEGPDNEHTYPALLQNLLRAAYPGRQIEVLNCGVEGIRTRSQFLRLPDYLELEPDLMVLYEGVNDMVWDLHSIFDESPLRRIAKLSHSLALLIKPFAQPTDDELRQAVRALTISNIEELRRITARKGIRMALCSITAPDYQALPDEGREFYDIKRKEPLELYYRLCAILNSEVRNYCAEQRLLYLPVAENMRAVDSTEFLTDFCHMRPDGIAWKARIIFECMKSYIGPALSTPPESPGGLPG